MSQQSINPYNYRNYNQVGFSSQIPAMQGQPTTDEVIQAAGAGQLSNRINASKDANPLTTLGLTLGLGYGIGQGMDYFGKACEGQYDKTLLGKVGGWGDKFSKNTKLGRFIENSYRKLKIWAWKKEKTSKLMYTLNNHSTSPSKGMPWDFARLPFHGLYGFWSMDAKQVLEHYTNPISDKPTKIMMFFPAGKTNDFNRLAEVGMSKDEIKAFQDSLKGKPFQQQAIELQWKELEKLGVDVRTLGSKTLKELQDMAKEIKINKTFGVSVDDFTRIIEDPIQNKKDFMKLWEHAAKNNDLKIQVNRFDNTWWGKIKSHFCSRQPSFSEYYNKGLVATGKGNKSLLGRMFAKGFGFLIEGSTNRFAGGKLAPLIQASILADILYHTYKAPKGEHTSTLMDRSVHDFASFVAMIPALIGLHKIGGFKYLGVDNAGKEAYREALKLHNANVKARVFNSKKEFKDSLKAVNALLNRKDLNFFQKGLAKLGELVNCGNEHSFAYRSNKAININWLRKIANTNLVGVPFRIWAVAFAVSPFIAKAAVKLTHAIFGKPTVSVLDEDKEEEIQNPEQTNPQTQPQQVQQPVDPNKLPDSNLIKQTVTGQRPQPQNPQTAQNNNEKDENGNTLEPVRTYIPSPVGMVQNYDPTKAEMALMNADKAEKEIQNLMGRMK